MTISMKLEEKKEKALRLQKRIIRFQNLMLHNMETMQNNTGNRYDDVFLNVLEKFKPVLHTVMLAKQYQKLQATKTT